MFLALLMAVQLPLPLSPALDQKAQGRLEQCLTLAVEDPAKAEAEAARWRLEGGGFFARQCLGLAYANQERWESAAGAFEEAAREAEIARDAHSADFWAQAGNAWIAAGNFGKARSDLDAALASGTLTGVALGEAYLDRARTFVAQGDLDGARNDLDHAVVDAAADPLAWLLSAQIARRMDDLPRARQHIAEALRRSSDDASVQLEAGYIAGWAGDYPSARSALARAIELAPGSPQAEAARKGIEKLPAEH